MLSLLRAEASTRSALFRSCERCVGLLPGFDPLDIPDLEAVRVQLNASPVLYDDPRDGLLILREEATASVTRPAVTRTIEDLRDRAARKPAVLQPKLDESPHQRVHARDRSVAYQGGHCLSGKYL